MMHTGWRTRGYLPHHDDAHLRQHIVFRLADSLPASVLEQIARERKEERVFIADRALDHGVGERWLRRPEIARMVRESLLRFDRERYRLIAWCIMPNHVHVLAEQVPGWPLARVVHGWKSFTAHEANRVLGRSGPFWAREYFERATRGDQDADACVRYIVNNPVKAGLCEVPEDWTWSSAAEACRRDAGAPAVSTGGATCGSAGVSPAPTRRRLRGACA